MSLKTLHIITINDRKDDVGACTILARFREPEIFSAGNNSYNFTQIF